MVEENKNCCAIERKDKVEEEEEEEEEEEKKEREITVAHLEPGPIEQRETTANQRPLR